jgi:flagellar assembly factor FliW
MQLDTTRFGSVSIDEEQVVTFPEGIPGFEDTRRYIFLPHPTAATNQSPFRWMQCLDNPTLAFPVVSPWRICADYSPTVPGLLLRELGIEDIREQAQIWSIVTIPASHPERATVNLLAPILINRATRQARQAVLLNDSYSLRAPLRRTESEHAEAGDDAGYRPITMTRTTVGAL